MAESEPTASSLDTQETTPENSHSKRFVRLMGAAILGTSLACVTEGKFKVAALVFTTVAYAGAIHHARKMNLRVDAAPD